MVDAGGVVAGGHDGVGEGRRPVRVGGRVGADGLLVLGRVGRGRVAVREDGRGLVGVGDRHGDRLGRRVGGARAVRGGDDDHVVLAAAVGGGRLVVGDAVGLEPELGVAVDLEEVGVGAAGDREGHGVAGVGVGRGEDDHVLDVLRDGGGGARREGRVLVVDVGDRHGDRLGRRVGGVGTVGRGDGDHVVLAAAVGGGRLVVGDAVGLEPELGVAVDLEEVGVDAAGDREGHGVAGVGVAGGEDDHVLDVLGYRGGGARREGRVLVVDVLDGHGHGDRVVVGAGDAVGDLDDDDAGVGVVAGAAAGRLEVRGAVERQDAAVGDAEQVVVDAGGVVAGGHDGVGEGRGPVRVGGRVGAGRR